MADPVFVRVQRIGHVDNANGTGLADLLGRKTHPALNAHGIDHLLHQPPDFSIDLPDRLRLLPQHRVAGLVDIQFLRLHQFLRYRIVRPNQPVVACGRVFHFLQ